MVREDTWYGMHIQDADQWINEIYQGILFMKEKKLSELPKCEDTKHMITFMERLIKF